MTSRERMLNAIAGKDVDHTPMYCWCFGFCPPENLRWVRNAEERKFWYTMRLEHIHTLPQDWDILDDFERVKKWQELGIDDVIDISLPWSLHPDARKTDWKEAGLLCASYETPAGVLTQKVRKTDEKIPPGWVVQPDRVKLFEDFNLPRSEKFPVTSPKDLKPLEYLLSLPSAENMTAYNEKIRLVKDFVRGTPVAVQGWSAFGMDAAVWLMGVNNAIMSAMTEPEFFQELIDTIYRFDVMRTEKMIDAGGIDIIVQRGWYSSTDFWSPQLFRKFVMPNLKKLTDMVHDAGLKFAYTMTTGVPVFVEELAGAGVDLLYYADPEQEHFDLADLKDKIAGRFCVAGGISTSLTLNAADILTVKQKTSEVLRKMGRKRFILSPVDALFPDTPYRNLEAMIEQWKEER
jgi:uroporphyrinogen-III decarboxylase